MASGVISKTKLKEVTLQNVSVEGSRYKNDTYVDLGMTPTNIKSITAISSSAAIMPVGVSYDSSNARYIVFLYNIATSTRTADITIKVLY